MQRRNVLFPDPLEPMMLMTSPALAESETPLRTSFSPKRLWMSRTTSFVSMLLAAAGEAAGDAAGVDESNEFSPVWFGPSVHVDHGADARILTKTDGAEILGLMGVGARCSRRALRSPHTHR